MDDKREWEKLLVIADANRSECRRLVEENEPLRLDLVDVRAKYGFPLDLASYSQWFNKHEQLGHFDLLNGLNQDVDTLMQRHSIPERWRPAVQDLLVFGEVVSLVWGMGFPKGSSGRSNDGTIEGKLIIDDQTAVWSPIVQDFIRRRQEALAGIPPQPTVVNARGKKDWRPVWEWARAHPQFTHAEITQMLGYKDRTHVSKKLKELDFELLSGLEDPGE